MGWMDINEILQRETALTTHGIINNRQPEHMAFKMVDKYNKNNNINTRTTGPGKLGSRPKQVAK